MECLNCNNALEQNFCPHCGQKTSTRRFSLKYVFDYAVLSGIFSIHSGILFTIKSLFTNPGVSLRKYIRGNRVVFFNAVTLLLLSLTVMYLIDEYANLKFTDIMGDDEQGINKAIESFIKDYPRLVYLINIPFMSIATYLFFRKANFNFAEHLVLNTYNSAAQVLLSFPLIILTIFYKNIAVLTILYQLYSFLIMFYSVWLYYHFFSDSKYKKLSRVLRGIMSVFFFAIMQIITIGIIVAIKKLT